MLKRLTTRPKRLTTRQNVTAGARALSSGVILAALLLSAHASALHASASQRVSRTAAGKQRARKPAPAARVADASHAYACPMHPDVTAKSPGAKCPKCGMRLVKREAPAAGEARGGGEAAGGAGAAVAPSSAGASEVSAVSIPDTIVTDQDGRRLNFYTDLVKNRTVAINFVFTTCTTVCPPMTATFRRVQQQLGERVGRDVWMVSITVDPTTDTPEALKAYAARHRAGPGWKFLTGKKENVDWVLYKLGGYTEDKAAHSGVLIIGNEATGEWLKVHAMSKPSEIAAAVIKLAEKGNAPPSQ